MKSLIETELVEKRTSILQIVCSIQLFFAAAKCSLTVYADYLFEIEIKKTLPQSEQIFGKTGAEWASMIWQKQFQEILTYWDCMGWKIVPKNTKGRSQCCMEIVGPTISAVCKSAANRSKTWFSANFAKKTLWYDHILYGPSFFTDTTSKRSALHKF